MSNQAQSEPPMLKIKRVGGLIFFRIGRFGGSFYWAKSSQPSIRPADSVMPTCAIRRRSPTYTYAASKTNNPGAAAHAVILRPAKL